MDPTTTELAAMSSLADVLTWVGIAGDLETSWLRQLGGPTLVRQLVLIPRSAWDAAVLAFAITDTSVTPIAVRALTPVELGMLEGLWRVCNLRLGLPASGTTLTTGGTGVGAPPVTATPAITAGSPARKLKIAAVLDQADDSEATPMDPSTAARVIEDFVMKENEGEDLRLFEEATVDQLSALKFRVDSGSTPFADFAVWRPYGARLGRLLKFQAFFPLPNGGFQMKELSGPPDFEDWKKCWVVFRVAALILKIASRKRLDMYEEKIETLAKTLKQMWWLVAMADIRMRSEQLERLRRKALRDDQERVRAGLGRLIHAAMP